MKSQIWLLDPRPEQACIVNTVRQGFELSEASNTPVMLMMRIRACHMHGQFPTKDNIPATYSTAGQYIIHLSAEDSHMDSGQWNILINVVDSVPLVWSTDGSTGDIDIAVTDMGKIGEQGDRVSLFHNPKHPYTQALLSSVPSANPYRKDHERRSIISGDPPNPINLPPGCRFASRCPLVEERCRVDMPSLEVVTKSHRVACHLVDKVL